MAPDTGQGARQGHGTRGHQPDPRSIALSRFCARLKQLQSAAGLTRTSLAATTHLSTSQMSDILNGKIKRPPDWDVVNKVVHACLTHAKQVGKPLPGNFRDEEDWRRRYDDLEQGFDAAPPPRRSTQAATERTVETVSQSDPFDLGVHRALPPTGTVSLEGPDSLTPYLQRDHDKELRAALHQAATGGPSVFAVLAADRRCGARRSSPAASLRRSDPAQNPRPAPLSTMTRQAGSWSASCSAPWS